MSQRYKPTVSTAALRGDPHAVFVTKRNEEADLQQKGLGEVGTMAWASRKLIHRAKISENRSLHLYSV